MKRSPIYHIDENPVVAGQLVRSADEDGYDGWPDAVTNPVNAREAPARQPYRPGYPETAGDYTPRPRRTLRRCLACGRWCGHRHPLLTVIKTVIVMLVVLAVPVGFWLWPMYTNALAATNSVKGATATVADWATGAFKRQQLSDVERIVAGKSWTRFQVETIRRDYAIDTRYCEGLGFTEVDDSCRNDGGFGSWLKRRLDSKTAVVHLEGSVGYSFDLSQARGRAGDLPDTLVLTVPPPEITAYPAFDKSSYGETGYSLSGLFKDANAMMAVGQAEGKMEDAARADTDTIEAAREQLQAKLESLINLGGSSVTLEVVIAEAP